MGNELELMMIVEMLTSVYGLSGGGALIATVVLYFMFFRTKPGWNEADFVPGALVNVTHGSFAGLSGEIVAYSSQSQKYRSVRLDNNPLGADHLAAIHISSMELHKGTEQK